jgi:hypothetical protein
MAAGKTLAAGKTFLGASCLTTLPYLRDGVAPRREWPQRLHSRVTRDGIFILGHGELPVVLST